jgi:hypothetical protein
MPYRVEHRPEKKGPKKWAIVRVFRSGREETRGYSTSEAKAKTSARIRERAEKE